MHVLRKSSRYFRRSYTATIENPYVAFRAKFDAVRRSILIMQIFVKRNNGRGERRRRVLVRISGAACNCEVILFHSESLQPARA